MLHEFTQHSPVVVLDRRTLRLFEIDHPRSLKLDQLRSKSGYLVGSHLGRRHCFGVLNDLRRVQQRFRRDTTNVQADTAESRIAFDEDDIEPEVGGAKGGVVAARTGTQNDELRLQVGITAGIGCR